MKLIYESYYRNLGQNIAFYRKRRGWTQLNLCELAEISRNHLSHIENADCAVSLTVATYCLKTTERGTGQ